MEGVFVLLKTFDTKVTFLIQTKIDEKKICSKILARKHAVNNGCLQEL